MDKELVGKDLALLISLLNEVFVPCAYLEAPIFARKSPDMRGQIGDVRPGFDLLSRINVQSEQRP